MAVSGLHSVSVYDSAFLQESRSPSSRLWCEPERPITRASSIMQMWRDLECEHVVSHPNSRLEEIPIRSGSETSGSDYFSRFGSVNGDGSLENAVRGDNETVEHSLSSVDSDCEHDDNSSFCSEQPTGLGETEMDRVRQVFNGWMNSGVQNHSPNDSLRNSRSRPPWLGKNECERVRTIREWVQINTQQRGSHGCPRDESITEIGSQIEQVCDGRLVSHHEVAERRPLRKLCGRQALLDMLERAQGERKEEIHKLLQHRPVTDFAHRNRIQTFLKGRFLLNQTLVRDERPTCTAVNELGLLKQRHVVSDLRDGFLSRLGSGSLNGAKRASYSTNDLVDLRNGQLQPNNGLEDEGETYRCSEHVSSPTENVLIQDLQHNAIQDVNPQENIVVGTVAEVRVLGNDKRDNETSNIELIRDGHSREDATIGSCWRVNSPEDGSEQISNSIESVPTHFLEANPLYNANNLQCVDASEQVSSDPETFRTCLLESNTLCNVNSPQNVDASVDHGAASHMYSTAEEQDLSAHVEELQESESEHEENDLQQFSGRENSEWTEVNIEDSMLQETSDQWYYESDSDVLMEQTHIQESDEEWPGNVLQDSIDGWLDVPSGQETGSAGRADSFYFPDEENMQTTELRQLLRRRPVSTLLQSGFRDNLDQLIQSYVQRQNDTYTEWDLDDASPSHASLEEDREQEPQHHNQDPALEARWDQELQNDVRPDLKRHQYTGNELEIINELRIDMARLQQRMNNMQNMLEACMDMQFELQRSLRQEVFAALNRSCNISTDKAEIAMNDSKWDHVRKGICCICCDNQIDTLLFRCGHMCTCSKCAEYLVQGRNCPMCYAPVIEVVPAYFTR